MSSGGWRECGAGGIRWLEPPDLPRGIRIATTLRTGGTSAGPYESLNLAAHVGDAAQAVTENRRRLRAALGPTGEPRWLRQVHGTRIVAAEEASSGAAPEADGAVVCGPGTVLAVLTADCLPVVLAPRDGSAVAIAHAGWRGLAGGVVEAALEALAGPPGRLSAWIAPGIGPARYLVGEDVRAAFAGAPGAQEAFAAAGGGRWRCNLALLARRRLEAAGVREVGDSARCTYSDPGRFYSYRRDGETGRMATLAWLGP